MTDDLFWLREQNAARPVKPPMPLISEYIEGRRVMPTNTPFPGPWENSRTPYATEIIDCMSPYSPIQIVDIMKSGQIGLSAAAENVILYWADENPTEILYCSATEALLEKWATKRLDPAIDSVGMRAKLQATTNGTGSRRTGDKIFSKNFLGGNLSMASLQSASGLRSDSIRLLILDEIDGAPRELKTGEGNPIDVAMVRTNGWGNRRKVMRFSTPTTVNDTLIGPLYEEGDQRKYFLPCPLCGVFQVLDFQHLKHEKRAGHLYKAWYECPHCNRQLQNYNKTEMFKYAEWRPTAQSVSPLRRSYHIDAMISPVGMFTWFEMVEKHLEAQEKPDGMRSFTNLYLGLPYRETGTRPKLEKMIELRGEYREGEVPDGVLFLTMGLDVQDGSEKDPDNPARLELEILGHGIGFRTFSVRYKVIKGAVDDPYSGAWAELHEWALEGGLAHRRSDGREFTPQIIFMDSGSGGHIDTVYAFTSRWQGSYPSKGVQALKKKKTEVGDEVGPHNFIRYRIVKSKRGAGDVEFVDISTNFYKTHTYANLALVRQDGSVQKPGFCDFPRDRGEAYFKMLTAEDKHTDGSFHAHGRRNESLDCRVMALCAADMFLDSRVYAMRMAAKNKGADEVQQRTITARTVLELFEKQTTRGIVWS